MNVIINRNPIKTAYTKVLDSSTYEQPFISFYLSILSLTHGYVHMSRQLITIEKANFSVDFSYAMAPFLLPIAEMTFRFYNPYFRSNWNAIK